MPGPWACGSMASSVAADERVLVEQDAPAHPVSAVSAAAVFVRWISGLIMQGRIVCGQAQGQQMPAGAAGGWQRQRISLWWGCAWKCGVQPGVSAVAPALGSWMSASVGCGAHLVHHTRVCLAFQRTVSGILGAAC
jgi:hypothetical protein